jgi:hypothetical protein
MNEVLLNIWYDKSKIKLVIATLNGLNHQGHMVEKAITELQNQLQSLSYMEKRLKEPNYEKA